MFLKFAIADSTSKVVLHVDKGDAVDATAKVLLFRDRDGNGRLNRAELESPAILRGASFDETIDLLSARDLAGHFISVTIGVVFEKDKNLPTPEIRLSIEGKYLETADKKSTFGMPVQKVGDSWGFTSDVFIHLVKQ